MQRGLSAVSPASIEFARFLLVGGASSLGYAALTAWLVGSRGLPPLATSVAVYAIFIPLVYFAHGAFTFRGRGTRQAGFFIYAGMQVAFVALASFVTTRFVTGDMVADTALFLCTSVIAAAASFAVSRLAVFR